MQAIVIPLKVAGIGAANRQIQQMGKNFARLNQQAKITAQIRGGVGSVGTGGGGGAITVPKPPPLAKTQRMNRAQLAGMPSWWNPNLPGSKPPPLPKAQQSFGQRAMSALYTSRIGAGGLMPLVGKVAGLFGGPMTLAVTAATTAIRAMADITNQANENLKAFSGAMMTGGGSAAQTAIGRALGDTTGQMAREFSRNISSDPFAAGSAARAGIFDPGGDLFGDTNKTKNLIKWMDALRKMPEDQAIREARRTGTEALLKNLYLSNKTYDALTRTAAIQEQIYSKQRIRAAAEFSAQIERVQMNMESLTNVVGSFLMKSATPFLKFVADMSDHAVKFADSPAGRAGLAGGFAASNPALFAILKIFEKLFPTNDKKSGESAQSANTDALKKLTAAIQSGIYGGGERARGAVPRGWMGAGENKWAGQAASLGAFNL